MHTFSCVKCKTSGRGCNIRDVLKKLNASRELANTLDLAKLKITKPQHVHDLGVSRETALILGQTLAVKKRISSLNRRTGRKLSELSRRLDIVERQLGIGGDVAAAGGSREPPKEVTMETVAEDAEDFTSKVSV